MKNYLTNAFFGVANYEKFMQGLQHTANQAGSGGIFAGDNLFTFGKNLSFLDDEKFMAAVKTHAETAIEAATIWRANVLCWAAQRGMKLDGDTTVRRFHRIDSIG